MSILKLRPAADCKTDILSLGEVMVRLDPGEERIHTTRHFRAWEGGGEYNVARGLLRCFGKRAAVVTAIADNPVGRLLEDLMLQGGVNLDYVQWMPYDGIGRDVRVGLNFTERGFGVRAAVGCSDRANSASSKLKKGDVDWEKIFGEDGVRWFHTGGIYAGLSETTPDVVIDPSGRELALPRVPRALRLRELRLPEPLEQLVRPLRVSVGLPLSVPCAPPARGAWVVSAPR